MAMLVSGFCWSTEPVNLLEEPEADFQYFTSVMNLGILYDANDGSRHSYWYMRIVEYKGLISLDVGLRDFEQVEVNGDMWWQDLSPTIGLGVDVFTALEYVPALESIIDTIPDYIRVGAGVSLDLETGDATGYVAFTLTIK